MSTSQTVRTLHADGAPQRGGGYAGGVGAGSQPGVWELQEVSIEGDTLLLDDMTNKVFARTAGSQEWPRFVGVLHGSTFVAKPARNFFSRCGTGTCCA